MQSDHMPKTKICLPSLKVVLEWTFTNTCTYTPPSLVRQTHGYTVAGAQQEVRVAQRHGAVQALPG